ncbi:hypothetical protein PAPYR_5067 [Paratrimastix pyriformis]|uniref:EGF-like domain-containing protein n=1 Tax=Paratrimastix pyriformis TaxID=342808 RepID=A0ABQ8UM10_9EUKA|nr:hypothetical protein PAPYR_5067 [Paratrimastix pyriformis]
MNVHMHGDEVHDVWYVGVWDDGYFKSTVDVTATYSASCLNACEEPLGHGKCVNATGSCLCAAGWWGSDCSSQTVDLPLYGNLQNTLRPGHWSYVQYRTQADAVSAESFVVLSTAPLELYWHETLHPDNHHYHLRNTTSVATGASDLPYQTAIVRASPDLLAEGTSWLGVYYPPTAAAAAANEEARFSMYVDSVELCPHQCNHQGACKAGVCACPDPLYGSDCHAPLTLSDGAHLTGMLGGQDGQVRLLYPQGERLFDYISLAAVSSGCDIRLYGDDDAYPTPDDHIWKTPVGQTATLTLNHLALSASIRFYYFALTLEGPAADGCTVDITFQSKGSCHHLTSCGNCTADPACGWCASTKECYLGTKNGTTPLPGVTPVSPVCPADQWAFDSCVPPTPTPVPHGWSAAGVVFFVLGMLCLVGAIGAGAFFGWRWMKKRRLARNYSQLPADEHFAGGYVPTTTLQ